MHFSFPFGTLFFLGGAAGGMVGGQVRQQPLFKRVGALFPLDVFPDPVIEVPLALDFRVLQ